MTSSNGQHPQPEPQPGAHATSTVLALDGWGPIQPEVTTNGTHEAESPLPLVDAVPEEVLDIDVAPPGETREPLPMPSVDRALIEVLAAASALAMAVLATLWLGTRWRESFSLAVEPEPVSEPDQIADLRRKIALAIDPSLTPTPPHPSRFDLSRIPIPQLPRVF